MRISLRQIIKEAGPKERKKASGINFEHVRSKLSAGGEEIPRSAIDDALRDESNLIIRNEQLTTINDLNLSEDARKRLNPDEAFMIIAGAALSSDTKHQAEGKLDIFNWYLVTKELSPGSFGVTTQQISSVDQIKDIFNKEFNKASAEKEASEKASEKAKSGGYLSNDVVYSFGDGWNVVYVPAAGEIQGFGGDAKTSHDRVLEGDKNGLCLGSGMRLYQDNEKGKIYSVRDPENKPRVTIRIQDDRLQEAKGKNNNPPDVEGANHAREWFKSDKNSSLEYINNADFRNFPPGTIEEARESFQANNEIPYKNNWVSSWYRKGIKELDEDVNKKVLANDQKIISSGMGKKFKELAEPVVKYWCEKYLSHNKEEVDPAHQRIYSYQQRRDDPKEVLFGSEYYPPTHETYKVYRKLPEMVKCVEKLSAEYPEWFCKIGLMEFPEYRVFSEEPMKVFLKKKENIKIFFDKMADKDWAKAYLDTAVENYISNGTYYAGDFIKNYSKEAWAAKYIEPIIDELFLKDKLYFVECCLDFKYSEKYIKEMIKNDYSSYFMNNLDNKALEVFIPEIMNKIITEDNQFSAYAALNKYLNSDFIKPYIDDLSGIIYKNPLHILFYIETGESKWLDENAKNLIEIQLEKNPADFVISFESKDWAQQYLKDALERSVEKKPRELLIGLSYATEIHNIDIIKKYIDLAINNLKEADLHSIFIYIEAMKNSKLVFEFVPKIINHFVEKYPRSFIAYAIYDKSEWIQEYLDAAGKRLAEVDPRELLYYAGLKSEDGNHKYLWAEKYKDYAIENLQLTFNNLEEKLAALSLALKDIGFKKEAEYILRLS